MARQRDEHYEAHRSLKMSHLLHDEELFQIALATAVLESMNDVRAKMEKEGAGPNKERDPEVIITFSCFGGKQYRMEGPT